MEGTPSYYNLQAPDLVHLHSFISGDSGKDECGLGEIALETSESSSINTVDQEALNRADDSCTQYSQTTVSDYAPKTDESFLSETAGNKETQLRCEWFQGTEKCKYLSADYREFFDHVGNHLGEARIDCLEDGKNQFYCDWCSCGFTTTAASDLLGHVIYHAIHTRAKLKGLQTFKEASIYKPTCSDPTSRNEIPILPTEFICDWTECGHHFTNPQRFYWHVDNHVDFEGKERCKWEGCEYRCNKFCRLKVHTAIHTGERQYSCPFCGLFFSGKERIREHWLRMEQQDPELLCHTVSCQKCGKSFGSHTLLKEHQRTHKSNSTVYCPHCGPSKIFPYQSRLDRHIVQVHSGRRAFKCRFCSHSAKTESDLKRHVDRHEVTTAFKCSYPDCLESFLTIVSLRTHTRKAHGGADTRDHYVCRLCEKRFRYVSTLTRHLESYHRLEPAPPSLRFKIELNPDGTRFVANAVPIPQDTNEDEGEDCGFEKS